MTKAPDQFEEYYRKAFAGYEEEPPRKVWKNIRRAIHPEDAEESRKRLLLNKLTSMDIRYKVASVMGLVIVLFLAGLYFSTRSRYFLKGHAYAGERHLCRGTAILFEVSDKTRPWDSVVYYRSAVIDDDGYYHFKRIEEGKYLLRIEPEEGSDHSRNFSPSWFNMHHDPAESHLIVVSDDVHKADVHLIKREGDK